MVSEKAIREKLEFLKKFAYSELNHLKSYIINADMSAEKCFIGVKQSTYYNDAKKEKHFKSNKRAYLINICRKYKRKII